MRLLFKLIWKCAKMALGFIALLNNWISGWQKNFNYGDLKFLCLIKLCGERQLREELLHAISVWLCNSLPWLATRIRPSRSGTDIPHIWARFDTKLLLMMKNKIWRFQNLQVASDVINLKIISVKMAIWMPTRLSETETVSNATQLKY